MRFRGEKETRAEVQEGGRSGARARGLKVAADEFSHRLAARLLRTFTEPSLYDHEDGGVIFTRLWPKRCPLPWSSQGCASFPPG